MNQQQTKRPKKSKEDIEKVFCLTPTFKASWPHLFEAKSFNEGQEGKFSVTMLFNKTTKLDELLRAEKNAIIEAFGEDPKKWPAKGTYHRPFRTGDEEKSPIEKDMIVVKASSKFQPQVLDAKKREIRAEDDQFYAGCLARATLIAAWYKSGVNKGVTFYLQNVQKVDDGERISSRPSAMDQFGEVDDGSDNSDSYGSAASEDEEDVGF